LELWFNNFYIFQGRKAGQYIKHGQIWTYAGAGTSVSTAGTGSQNSNNSTAASSLPLLLPDRSGRPGEANLAVIREKTDTLSAVNLDVIVDDKTMLSLSNGSTGNVFIPNGKHTIYVQSIGGGDIVKSNSINFDATGSADFIIKAKMDHTKDSILNFIFGVHKITLERN
jgi:hypothetical protein